IGWVIDHPKRDLPGAVLAAYQLITRGASVVIVPMYEQGVDVPRLGLDTLVVNYARDANLDLMQAYSRAGLPLYVLDTEGGVLAERGGNSPPAMAAYVRNSGYADILSGYFFWGSRLQAAFREHETMPPARLEPRGRHRLVFPECGLQPAAPEKVAGQNVGITAVANIGRHGRRRVTASFGQHAALGVEHIERQSGPGISLHQIEIGVARIIDDQRIQSEPRHIDALFIHRHDHDRCPTRDELIGGQNGPRQVALGVIDDPSDAHEYWPPGDRDQRCITARSTWLRGPAARKRAGGSGYMRGVWI